ncbi:hypothetical protein CK203_021811 [Vitis vinifera]|uniref:Uncharacterized protein n=1 Tax=Vitis vinifera TaxID=29760 RepID=A0A438JFW2_VITVI|nr:hypothetical protein CK203_021811 [Vitis vinifera]
MDKYFAPRNTQGAQPSMRSVLVGKEATWRADMAVGRFFYDACIPINAVNSFYFKPMLDVISTIGILFVKSVDVSDIVKDATNLFMLFDEDIGKMDHVAKTCKTFIKEIPRPSATRFATTFIALKSLHDHKHDLQALENFCNKLNVIGGVMDAIDQKVLKGKLEIMNEMKLFRSITRKKIYDTIDYACIDETDFWIVDNDQPTKVDVEELENLLYEEGSIPINEVEGSSSHIDDEDGGGMAIKGLDVKNFGFPDAYFQSPYSNFQNE